MACSQLFHISFIFSTSFRPIIEPYQKEIFFIIRQPVTPPTGCPLPFLHKVIYSVGIRITKINKTAANKISLLVRFILLLGVIVVVLFATTKLPQLGSGVGQAIRNFKKGLAETEELNVTTPKKETTKAE